MAHQEHYHGTAPCFASIGINCISGKYCSYTFIVLYSYLCGGWCCCVHIDEINHRRLARGMPDRIYDCHFQVLSWRYYYLLFVWKLGYSTREFTREILIRFSLSKDCLVCAEIFFPGLACISHNFP